MAEFEPITTQEAFDVAVADRLSPFADYDDLTAQTADYAIRKDAQSLAKLLKPQTPKSPPRSTEPAGGSSRRDALRAFTNNLMSKGE